MTLASRAWAVMLASALLTPVAADAQQRNPYANLFGREPQRTGNEITVLDLRSQAGVQWGQTLKEQVTGPYNAIPAGISAGADVALAGQVLRDRYSLMGQGRYSYQEYRQDPAFGAPAFDAGARLSVDATTKLTFEAAGNFTRSPFYQLLWATPERVGPMVPTDRSAIFMLENDTIQGSAGITSNYTNRSTLTLNAYVRETSYKNAREQDFYSQGASAQWKRRLTRDFTFRAGYGRDEMRQQDQLGVDRTWRLERLDLGVDFARSLSLTRRTTLAIDSSTSMVKDNEGVHHYRIDGGLLLTKGFQRTWQFQIGARRSTDLLPGFNAPVFSERGYASLAGYLAKRLVLNVNADAGQGQAGFNDPRKFMSYTGDARLTFGVMRHLGVFAQYVYNQYEMPSDALTPFFRPQVARQAVSIGVEAWTALIDKEKVTSDSR